MNRHNLWQLGNGVHETHGQRQPEACGRRAFPQAMPTGICLAAEKAFVISRDRPSIGMCIGKAGSVKVLAQNSLVKSGSCQVVMSCVTDVDLGKVHEGRTVGNSRSDNESPGKLTTKQQLTETTLQEREDPNGVSGSRFRAKMKSKLVQPLAQDFG
jgi:hypothetical protein